MQPKVILRDTHLGAQAPSSVCSCASFQALNTSHIPPQLHSDSPTVSRFLRQLCRGAILPCTVFLHLLPLLFSPVHRRVSPCPSKGLCAFVPANAGIFYVQLKSCINFQRSPLPMGTSLSCPQTAMIGYLIGKQIAHRGPSGLLRSLISSQKNVKSSWNIL